MQVKQHVEMVAQAIDFIESNLREPLGVQEVCALSSLSPWQFQRVFRTIVGDSIGNYIRGRRLALAANCLQKSATPPRILDVAIEFQFGYQEAFTRAFKTSFGMSPVSLSAQDYAIFEVSGFHESCYVTADYIYGIWLPQSEYTRAPGTDFELFNHKLYRRGDSESVSFYYLPIA